MTEMTRRTVVATAVAAATGVGLQMRQAQAAAPLSDQQVPGLYRYKLGQFELTALYDGVWDRSIDDKFVRNADFAEVRKALSDAFMPDDKLTTPFTTLLVNTGRKLVLLDTGTGGQIAPTAGVLNANLAAAGIVPESIDQIVISHFHPDHINGIKDRDGNLIFPNAEILVPESEWAYWMDEANMNAAPPGLKLSFLNFRRVFSDIAKHVTRFRPGVEVAPGIATIAAPGHTPGHTVFSIQSGNESMMVLSDTTQHPALFARHPEWQPVFDMDGEAAVATRKKLLDRAAADRMLVTGYHFPFPACGHIIKTATGYEHVPAVWQPRL
jgi:glyoxylase-like metal-dependent hydrolase (beta-lactamase superfamily II)